MKILHCHLANAHVTVAAFKLSRSPLKVIKLQTSQASTNKNLIHREEPETPWSWYKHYYSHRKTTGTLGMVAQYESQTWWTK